MITVLKTFSRRHALRGIVLFSAMFLVIGVFVARAFIRHNFHVVSAGQLYRSAQLDAASLTRVIQEHGIKSILNLRGADGGEWYNTETNKSQELGVRHFDFALEAGTELTDQQMEQVLAMIGTAPKPMLIHCKSGADRTGLVGALYLYSVEGKSSAQAGRELTVFCGHVPFLFWRDTIAMDRSFERYVEAHTPATDVRPKPAASLSKQDLSPLAADHTAN